MKHLFFCFGARGKNGLHARLLRGIRPEGVEIVCKTCKVKPCYLSVFPVDWLKNECGAWLKIRWVKGFLFASLSLSASGSPKEKEVRADHYPSRTSGDETQGECYGVISPVAVKIRLCRFLE